MNPDFAFSVVISITTMLLAILVQGGVWFRLGQVTKKQESMNNALKEIKGCPWDKCPLYERACEEAAEPRNITPASGDQKSS